MILTSAKRKKHLPQKNSNQRGFSLFEVLIALALSSIMLGLVVSNSFSEGQKLDDALSELEKAVRFAQDEAVIRNSIIRVHFFLDRSPQEYTVEYGPNDNFVLPSLLTEEDEDQVKSVREEDEKKKELEVFEKKFNKVREFSEKNIELSELIKVIGVGSELNKQLSSAGNAAIYFYPTGERDGSIVFIGTSEEVVALKMLPFSQDVTREYVTLDDVSEEELSDKQMDVSKALFDKWLKE